MKTAIITGISGQDGAYLAKLLLEKKYIVIGLVRNLKQNSLLKLRYLKIENDVILEECDLTDITFLIKIIEKYKPDEIYNLAAQSSVFLSFKQPISTVQFNIISVLNLLESIRIVNPKIKIYQASSSEMYGKVEDLPITIDTPMHPLSPYAISKASGYWLIRNYRESYQIFAANGVLFNHESYLRDDNFFVKKIIKEAFEIKAGKRQVLKVGNLKLKRDYGYSPKYVEAMWLILQNDLPDDYIICSGKSISLEEIVYYVFDKLDISKDKIEVDPALFRPVDIEDIFGNNYHSISKLNWNYDLNFYEVLDLIMDEYQINIGNFKFF